jgi:cytidine deaminase
MPMRLGLERPRWRRQAAWSSPGSAAKVVSPRRAGLRKVAPLLKGVISSRARSVAATVAEPLTGAPKPVGQDGRQRVRIGLVVQARCSADSSAAVMAGRWVPGQSRKSARQNRPMPARDATRLSSVQEALLAAARAVREHAHAPYSRFAVGAAVLDEQGRIHAGCNVENAAYPQGWCAETSAIAAMVAAGGRRVEALAVCAVAQEPVTPCGGCRQKLREFAADNCPVWVGDGDGLVASFTLGQLLPHSFGPAHLPR